MDKNYRYYLTFFIKSFMSCLLMAFGDEAEAQNKGIITGRIKYADTSYSGMQVTLNSKWKTETDNTGLFEFKDVPFGKAVLEVGYEGVKRYRKAVEVNKERTELQITLTGISAIELDEVFVKHNLQLNSLGKLGAVRETAIFEAKKNDVLIMKNINANLATNNTRQVFAKVAGTNVWENDGSGIQVNVSSRGLSPNRSWEYNMRQNSYDIAADILGYPDMYYSPPMDAISHIEVVRGSASLQYGTQMGGLLNFILKKGSTTKPLEVEMKQSVGSYGLFNSYNSIGGTKNKWSYFGYFHHRTADGWRENSNYKWNTGYASVSYKASEKLEISAEYTRMNFLLHLSAGLTDSMYKADARQSVRERNWFKVNWNIPSVKIDYRISNTSRLTVTSYMLLSSRKSIENTKTVNNFTDTGYRDIRNDYYHNFGSEARYLTEYKLSSKMSGILTGGVRFYKGRTLRGQGLGSSGKDPDYSFLHPDHLEYSDYKFRNTNVALFAENVFRVGRFSVVPGIRYEYIKFYADGYFNSAGVKTNEKGLLSKRQFPLVGVGMEYKLQNAINLYANFTQGYRAANFNDIRITAPNIVIDPNLKDSRGHNIDLGIRGRYKTFLNFDISGFYLSYHDRIGLVSRKNPDNTTYLFSTNVANSRNTGLETFAEFDVLRSISPAARQSLSVFTSYSYIDARYIKSDKDFLKDKKVEFAPQNILRSGLTYKNAILSSTINYSHVSKQFSDANNTVFTATGSNGVVPAYHVLDWSSTVSFSNYKVGLSINNFTNNKYFTRRATSYPGPGIIPAEPRVFLVSFEVKL